MDRSIRQKKILDIIIRTHIDKANPVCSRYISTIMGLSSATIRNTMSELEDEGYLEQPHTSSGRVPTERAYRAYVNSLIGIWETNMFEIRRINEELFARYQRYNEIIEHMSYIISKLTNYTSFVIYPKDHIYMDGASHILEQPEFGNLQKVKNLLRMLDEKEKLLALLNAYIAAGALKIHIGRENSLDGFQSCSVVTASYIVRNKVVGGLGIIGPIRMKYGRVVPLVKYLSDSISRMLEQVYE